MASPLRFHYAPVDAAPESTLFVDGTQSGFRSLSHWPGNDTPAELKRDLSTGIALAWATLAPEERLRLRGTFDSVANNHYDTDGVLSVWAVLQPELALGHSDLLLRAAATGDFGTWNGPEALALELTLMCLPSHAQSPVPRTPGESDTERKGRCYAWAFVHLPELLAAPFTYAGLWQSDYDRMLEDLQCVERGNGLHVIRDDSLSLAIVRTSFEHTRLGLNLAAGACTRVLQLRECEGGTRYRLMERVESWFELVSCSPPARRGFENLAAALGEREDPQESAACPSWWSTPMNQPVAQLGFSSPSLAGDGFSADPNLKDFSESRIAPDEVVALIRAYLTTG